jgi:membrane associated rhomboid family serine protease
MREPSGPVAPQSSIVMTLLIATVAVFVLQNVLNVFFPAFNGRNTFLNEWFALSGQSFRELKVWTLFSYNFLHSPQHLIHILGNMLMLFFVGKVVEPLIGSTRFLLLYIGGGLLGGFIYLLFHYHNGSPVIGASAAVSGIIAFACLVYAERPLRLYLFFVLPITVKPKWIFWGLLGLSVFGVISHELPALKNPQTGQIIVAHSTHLGGMLAGILFFRFVYSNANRSSRSTSARPGIELPEWFKRKEKVEPHVSYRVNRSSRDELQAEVDRILDKINSSPTGFGSLSNDEKKTLEQATDIFSK